MGDVMQTNVLCIENPSVQRKAEKRTSLICFHLWDLTGLRRKEKTWQGRTTSAWQKDSSATEGGCEADSGGSLNNFLI